MTRLETASPGKTIEYIFMVERQIESNVCVCMCMMYVYVRGKATEQMPKCKMWKSC